MAFKTEETLEKVGSFGLYQIRLFSIVSYLTFFSGTVLLVMTFSTAEPPWKCTANSTSCTLNGTFNVGHTNYDHRCSIPRSDWEFAVEGNFDSIVTEWDLVCDTAVYASLVNSFYFIFWMLGGTAASILGDKFGRKKLAFPCYLFMCLCGLLAAFAQRYWVFAVFRSLAGIGIGGGQITGFVLVMEYVGPRHRGAVGIAFWFPWIFAMFVLALLGYLIPSWRTLTIITSAPGLLLFICWWFTPESLRWLLMKRKTKEAEKTLKEAARVNGKIISDEDLALLKESNEERTRLGDIRDLFASRLMVYRTLTSWYCWVVCGMVYYGIMLSTPSVGGNMYLNFFISAVCEAAGMVIGIVALNKFGRKKTIAASLWVAGVAMVTAAILSYYDNGSDGYLAGKVLMAFVIGRFFITISFDSVFVHTSELFPTVVRNTAMGTSSSAARVGSALSPYIVYTQRVHTLMPFGIMAINAFISGLLFLTLPETHNKAMIDTVNQITPTSIQDSGDTAINSNHDDNKAPIISLHSKGSIGKMVRLPLVEGI